MTTTRSRIAAPLLALAVATSIWAGGSAGQAAAAPGPRTAASSGRALLAIDSASPGLTLHAHATLAPPKVLDLGSQPVGIGRVVEDQEGAERSEDAGTQVTVDLQAEVLFAKDSARLSSSARSRIASVAREIEPQVGTVIRVYGFTDDVGSAAQATSSPGGVLPLSRSCWPRSSRVGWSASTRAGWARGSRWPPTPPRLAVRRTDVFESRFLPQRTHQVRSARRTRPDGVREQRVKTQKYKSISGSESDRIRPELCE